MRIGMMGFAAHRRPAIADRAASENSKS